MICSIKLLKFMKDSNIASCNYSKIISWHLETLLMNSELDMTSNLQFIKSKKRIIEYLHNILFELSSTKYSLKLIHQILLLPSERNTRISKFDLKSSLVALMTDPDIYYEPTKILLHNPSYTDPNNHHTSYHCDIHHSSAFKNAQKGFCKTPNDILISNYTNYTWNTY